MADSTYKFIELVGTSNQSWEKAAAAAVSLADKTLRDLRIAEIKELDMQIEDGKVVAYRTKVRLSFRVESVDEKQYRKDPHSWLLDKEHTSFDG